MIPDIDEVADLVRRALPRYGHYRPTTRLVALVLDHLGGAPPETLRHDHDEVDEDRTVAVVSFRGRVAAGRSTLDCCVVLACELVPEAPEELKALASMLLLTNVVAQGGPS